MPHSMCMSLIMKWLLRLLQTSHQKTNPYIIFHNMSYFCLALPFHHGLTIFRFIVWEREREIGQVSLQTSLERNPLNLSYIFLLNMNFENLTIGLYVLYIFNMNVKFCLNKILFAIWSINLFFVQNILPQKLET